MIARSPMRPLTDYGQTLRLPVGAVASTRDTPIHSRLVGWNSCPFANGIFTL